MAHSGPSRACASFAPTMSVRIFGHFEQFSAFSARRALCSAHPCTPDAWTNGPYMTWVLCILVPLAHTPRGRSGATFVKVLAQSKYGQFCHFGNCGPNWDRHLRSSGAKCMGVAVGLLVDCVWNGRSDLKAGVEIDYWEHPEFWLILSSQKDPILGPQFHPSVWSIGSPISLCPQGAWT